MLELSETASNTLGDNELVLTSFMFGSLFSFLIIRAGLLKIQERKRLKLPN